MNETRLYFKLENLPDGYSAFYYYDGSLCSNKKELDSYVRTIGKSDLDNTLAVFGSEKDQILYYMNTVEYFHLIEEYDRIKNCGNDGTVEGQIKREELKDEILKAIRLKNKFKLWFKENGFEVPEVHS